MKRTESSQITGVSKHYSASSVSISQLQDVLWSTLGGNLRADLGAAGGQFARKLKDWKYDIEIEFPEIEINTSELRDKRPEAANLFHVYLRVHADGIAPEGNIDAYDPFLHLTINVIVKARSNETAPEGEFMCAWHLDSHPPRNSPDHNPLKDNFMHPRYHWQYGGSQIMEAENMDFGSHLLISSPRLSHLPLDIVLAIDFVLSNYYSKAWKTLKTDQQYIQLVQESRRRFWRPYLAWIVNNWPEDLYDYSFPFLV